MTAAPAPLITDDGEIIRIVVAGATWVLATETSDIVRRHRALYADGSDGASAFFHGFLLALGMGKELVRALEARNGKA